jgi:hypothetical protein
VAENKAAIENCAFDRNRDINIIIDRKLIFIFIFDSSLSDAFSVIEPMKIKQKNIFKKIKKI